MPARPHSAVTSAKPPRIHAPRTSHDDVLRLGDEEPEALRLLEVGDEQHAGDRGEQRRRPRPRTTPTAARSPAWPRATSNAATSIVPAAIAFVTRYADTFVPHVAGCAVV